ncbi:hypothetical protein CIW52_01085 [Mycolicibacterium sp. P9-64]|uniref:hypothetical protein n=1 Tax=Mycolicibacterium sp. P9-64 TaxID=2024612 RepID=UPI0011EEE75E|nr:hypothetical protein [Mycolicibacterium sp. P9-64]KAA0086556.1 hypothetical protein CIW52_01085 [Mycolicibacterium sp. P9-64]
MKRFAMAVMTAGAMSAAALGLAGTASAAGGADVTVNSLKTEGYSLQINGAQSANLTACTVTNVTKDGQPGPNPVAYVDIACPDGC